MPAQPIARIEYESVKPHVEYVSLEKVKIAIFDMKNLKT